MIAALAAVFILAAANVCMAGTIETSGDAGAAAVPLAAGIISLSHNDRKGVAQLIESYGTAAAVTLALKYTVKEERPNGENTHSFPSLHASSTFAAAGYLQRRYGWAYGLPAYAVSAYVCWSRIDAREHHFSDVLVGAAIGFGASRIFTKPLFNGVYARPVADKDLYGLVLSGTF